MDFNAIKKPKYVRKYVLIFFETVNINEKLKKKKCKFYGTPNYD